MARQLTPEEIVTLRVLKEKGQSNRQIARTLQVSEGSVRYHLSRLGKPDGRQNKPRKAQALADAIDFWLRTQRPSSGCCGRCRCCLSRSTWC
jgi:FixJ family two-component response regulator